MRLIYFNKSQSEQFSFIRIPKVMMTDEIFSPLSAQAKILYGLLLDKMCDAQKNRWIDEEGRVFVIYPVSEIMYDLNMSKGSTVNYIRELENIGLIEKKTIGHGSPNRLYVKNFAMRKYDN